MTKENQNRSWWGSTEIPLGEERRWCIGPLRFRIAHLNGEWRIRHYSGKDPLEDTVLLAERHEPNNLDDAENGDVIRFASRREGCEITLTPALADRPVVSHPTEPFYVLPGDETRLFVSTPVWLALGLESDRGVFEIPIVRPSDTWVGATTGDGQAAYSSQTFCRLRLEEIPFRPHRSVTDVHVRNRSSEPLRLERISVAVPHLSLYASSEGRLWTESITLTREADDPDVDIRIAARPPPEAAATQHLASPREPVVGNSLRRAFEGFF